MFLTMMLALALLLGLNNVDFFDLDYSIYHSEIPYDDERSDLNPNGYVTPSPHFGSDAAASKDDRSVNPKDNINNTSEGNGPLFSPQNNQNTSETRNLRTASRPSIFLRNYNDFVVESKVKLVAKGFNQREGVDFDETFSLMDKIVTPFGYFPKYETRVCKLNKSVYGLKQAPRQWNAKLSSALAECGFAQSKSDYSLFAKKFVDVFIVLLVYVDDIIITGNNMHEINKFKQFFKTKFMIKDLGMSENLLGN
nr:ribonuclease H-like domain-containing protein [Tanacetum cinerariifolium]